MKIAHVIRRLSFDDWGGTEQVVWNLAKAQKAAGHEVRIFATTALCATPHEVVEGLEIFRYRPIYPWWPMPKRLVEELDRKGGNPFVPGLGKALCDWRPDVIHCHAMARIAELCLRVGERGMGNGERIRYVISLHGGGANVPGEEAKSLKAPTRGRFPWGKLIDYALGWTRHIPEDFGGIVCVGEDEYERYRTKHAHVLYLPNGVDTEIFENVKCRMENVKCEMQNGHAPHTPFSILHSPFSILCVARIDRQKNQLMLVEWLGRHPEARLRLVGPVTQPDYRAEIEARAAALGVSDRLTIVGALKPGSPELIAEYAKADVFVLPSRHEPFGIVVLEAWAAGLPVIASAVGGLGRLCAAHPDATLTFPPGDANLMDAALNRLLSSKQVRDNLVTAGFSAVRDYDWRTLSQKLVAFYREIC